MKTVITVLAALAAIFVVYELQRQEDKAASQTAPPVATKVIPQTPWHYDEEIDPITKKTKAKTVGQLQTILSSGEPVVAEVIWDCADGTTESLKLEIDTFLNEKDSSGYFKILGQDFMHDIDYRFDGVASSVSLKVALSGVIRREYRNSVELFLLTKSGLYGRARYPGLYTAAGRDADGDFMYVTKAFYIVDPEFVARIPVEGGASFVIQFSLEEPSIKRILTQCGLTFGKPPSGKSKTNTTASEQRRMIPPD